MRLCTRTLGRTLRITISSEASRVLSTPFYFLTQSHTCARAHRLTNTHEPTRKDFGRASGGLSAGLMVLLPRASLSPLLLLAFHATKDTHVRPRLHYRLLTLCPAAY